MHVEFLTRPAPPPRPLPSPSCGLQPTQWDGRQGKGQLLGGADLAAKRHETRGRPYWGAQSRWTPDVTGEGGEAGGGKGEHTLDEGRWVQMGAERRLEGVLATQTRAQPEMLQF